MGLVEILWTVEGVAVPLLLGTAWTMVGQVADAQPVCLFWHRHGRGYSLGGNGAWPFHTHAFREYEILDIRGRHSWDHNKPVFVLLAGVARSRGCGSGAQDATR